MDSVTAVEKSLASVTPESPTEKSSIDAADTFSDAAYRKLIWKLDIHLLPPLFILWFISLIDRVNIGTARIQGLEKDLKMDPLSNKFNIATGLCLDEFRQTPADALYLVVVFVGLMLAEVIGSQLMSSYNAKNRAGPKQCADQKAHASYCTLW